MLKKLRGIVLAVLVTFILTSVFYVSLYNTFIRPDLKKNAVLLDVMNKAENNALYIKNEHQLMEGAINGVLTTLNDPFTYYMTPNKYKNMKMRTAGYFEGIGVEVTASEEGVMVVAPIEGTPAAKAGMRPLDVIVAVNGKEAKGMPMDQVIDNIRGKRGTHVKISIKRPEKKERIELDLIRDQIPIQTVRGEELKNNIGYIRISMFNDKTAQEFTGVLNDLKKKNIKGLIIDVRNNPGGTLGSVVEVAKQLVPAGKIVTVDYRAESPDVYYSELEKAPFPMVVLINEGSASAAEILAGSLHDTKSAVLVGTKSFGKGVVESVYDMGNGGGLALTVAEYLTPSGSHIHKKGIQPDVHIELPDNAKTDVQLDKALEVLQKKMTKKN